MDVVLRPARMDDVPALRRWDADPDVVASTGEDDGEDWEQEVPRQLPWRELLVAEEDGVPVGLVQLIDAVEEESHYWGDDVEAGAWALDIWIGEPERRGRGVGRRMMELALDRCFDVHGATAVLIDPLVTNVRALRFYERLGFAFVEERRFGDDLCRVYRMGAAEWALRAPSGGGGTR